MAEKKAPGVFRKPIKKAKWEKKYLKKIYLPADRDFLKNLADEEDGMIRISTEGLSKKDLKRLKLLGRVIKKNRKKVNFILILIIVLLAGGILFFNFYLKNRLVQQLLETKLEEVFEAQVDTGGVNLSIFRGEFSLDYMAIADAGNPLKNLVEFDSVDAVLSTAELLQGRVFIEELGFAGMKRGTAREVSGALEAGVADRGDEDAETPETGLMAAAGGSIDEVTGQLSALAGDFDAAALLESQKENFVSFTAVEESRAQVDEYRTYWEERIGEWNRRLSEWRDTAGWIGTVDADSFATLESAGSTIGRLRTVYTDAGRDYSELQTEYSSVQQQYGAAAGMASGIMDAVETDYRYIESIVTLPAGGKVDWAASVIEEQLSLPLSKYLDYLDRGLEWYGRFKRFSDAREEKKADARRNGRSLPPPADAPPAFTLVHAFASGREPELNYSFDLRNLVSEPDKWADETSLDIKIETAATGAATALIRETGLRLDVPAAPFDLGGSLSALDLGAFSGKLSVGSDVGWTEAGFSGRLEMTAGELLIAAAKQDSIVYRLISTSIESVEPLSAAGNFTWSAQGGFSIDIETELDERLGDAAGALIAEGAEEGLKILKSYLDEQLAGPLADFDLSKDQLGTYADKIKNYESEIEGYRKMADDKIREIEKAAEDRLRAQTENLIRENVPDEIVPEAGNALKDIGSKLKF